MSSIQKKNKEKQNKNNQMVRNKGTGAGGAKTNENGLKLEDQVRDIYKQKLKILKELERGKNKYKLLKVGINGRILLRAPQSAFRRWDVKYKFSKDNNDYRNQRTVHGAKEPDDAFIDMNDKIIYWIECKVQNGDGSKCEVLQTYNFKIRNLKRRYPGFKINYIYVLDQSFRERCPVEIKYMEEDNITIIWDDDENFEEKLISVIS